MRHRPRRARSRKLLAPLVLTLLVPTILFASSALAAAGTVIGTISPSSVPAGATTGLSFTLQPTSGQVGSFNLTAPTGWSITSLTPQAGVTLVGGTQIQGRNISASSSSPFTVAFSVQAPCSASSTAWTLVARSGGGFTGNSFAVDPSSVLSTPLSGTCTAAFVADPAEAAFNGGTKSENITSLPYSPSGGTDGSSLLKVLVSDAGGTPRAGISITLQLSPNPTSLTGPITATSDANGSVTFGTLAAPVSVGELGLGYVMTPTGSGVTGTASGEFGIYREGKPCTAGQCVVHDNISNPKLGATVTSANAGALGVLVQPLNLDCASTVPSGYKYLPLPTTSVIAWKFDGTGAQIITADIAKSLAKQVLDRGSSHLDVCFQADPLKPAFTDKFGNVVSAGLPGLLSDCSSAITQNCIISETASGGGGRLITFTVEDGKGRI